MSLRYYAPAVLVGHLSGADKVNPELISYSRMKEVIKLN